MSQPVRSLHKGPYQTYQEFSDVFDRAHQALNGGLSVRQARELGYFVPLQGEYLQAKPDPRFNPHGFTMQEKYLFGIQHGLTYDPLQWGMPFGKPVQGMGHNLVGSPDYPHPNWPLLAPRPPRHIPYPEDDENQRPRYRIY